MPIGSIGTEGMAKLPLLKFECQSLDGIGPLRPFTAEDLLRKESREPSLCICAACQEFLGHPIEAHFRFSDSLDEGSFGIGCLPQGVGRLPLAHRPGEWQGSFASRLATAYLAAEMPVETSDLWVHCS